MHPTNHLLKEPRYCVLPSGSQIRHRPTQTPISEQKPDTKRSLIKKSKMKKKMKKKKKKKKEKQNGRVIELLGSNSSK